ncbi:MAG: helix-turn-helix transcriptional regulator [Pseudobacteriovorax sp.]|nr:helix-turn-helix transcriptional regulator [Pseudobacteriovorax sp.]
MKAPIVEFSRKYNLSKRETDVLTLLVSRVVNAEQISRHLGISQNTVRIHVKNINTKVGVRSKSEILSSFIGFLGAYYDLPQDIDYEGLGLAISLPEQPAMRVN